VTVVLPDDEGTPGLAVEFVAFCRITWLALILSILLPIHASGDSHGGSTPHAG